MSLPFDDPDVWPEMMTEAEVAAVRQCDVNQLQTERANGTGIPYYVRGLLPLYPRDEVLAFLVAQKLALKDPTKDWPPLWDEDGWSNYCNPAVKQILQGN